LKFLNDRRGGVFIFMATVVRRGPGESEDALIAKFRRKIQAEKLLPELKEREFYKPPSIRRKEKMALLKGRKR